MKFVPTFLYSLLLCGLIILLAACGDMKPNLKAGQEHIADDELVITARLIEVMKSVSSQRSEGGVIRRFNQPKTLGCFDAEFIVPEQSDPALAQGLFGSPGSYPARVRFANATRWDDRKKDFHGMSIKVQNVAGNVLFGQPGIQDFILNSHPVLFAATPSQFLDFVEATHEEQLWKYFARPANWKSLWIAMRGRNQTKNPFADRFWSTTPYRLGHDQTVAVKYSVSPCAEAPELAAADHPDQTSTMMAGHLKQSDACFDFMVQFQADPRTMPIEDASTAWSESVSPFLKVARLRIAEQPFRTNTAMQACEAISFNPWQSLVEHQPLGGINRLRKESYAALAAYRGAGKTLNGGKDAQNH